MIRALSPEAASAGERNKRRRKVLSCYTCRRRKLQCDRALPACGRCVKAGSAQNCLYLDDPVDSRSVQAEEDVPKLHSIQCSGPDVSTHLAEKLEYQDRRIKQLESALLEAERRSLLTEPLLRVKVAGTRLPLTPDSIVGNNTQFHTFEDALGPNDRDSMLLRGRSFKTQFLGQTHAFGLIAHLPGLHEFTREAFETFPVIQRARKDMKQLDLRTDYAGSRSTFVSDGELKCMLPPRHQLDRHVQLYFDNYGTLYSIIHEPSFMRSYEAMWRDIKGTPPVFVAIVLLVSATVQCLDTVEPWLFIANSSAARETAIRFLQACEDWLRNQGQKRVTIAHFQVRFLILLAKQVNARKLKRVWTECGELVRYCMCAGLHRSPELIRKQTSPFDTEFRRRLWASVVELELQASLDRGMVPQNWHLQSDTTGPSNFADDQFDESTEKMPRPQHMSKFTSSSYLALASESVGARYHLTTSMNSIRQGRSSFEDVKRTTDEIHSHINNIPEWTDPRGQLAAAKLSLLLRQHLLILHDRFIRQAESSSERNFSAMLLIDTATQIIHTHHSLVNRKCHALSLLCQDQVRASLTLCHVSMALPPKDDFGLGRVVDERLPALMNDVVEMVIEKVDRFGREQRLLWFTTSAYSWWRSKKEPSRRREFMEDALNRVIRSYFRVMACQTVPLPAAMVRKEVDPAKNYDGYLEYMPTVNRGNETAMAGQLEVDGQDAEALDFDQIAAWTFDDWTFNDFDL